jgi:hypothetical protein
MSEDISKGTGDDQNSWLNFAIERSKLVFQGFVEQHNAVAIKLGQRMNDDHDVRGKQEKHIIAARAETAELLRLSIVSATTCSLFAEKAKLTPDLDQRHAFWQALVAIWHRQSLGLLDFAAFVTLELRGPVRRPIPKYEPDMATLIAQLHGLHWLEPCLAPEVRTQASLNAFTAYRIGQELKCADIATEFKITGSFVVQCNILTDKRKRPGYRRKKLPAPHNVQVLQGVAAAGAQFLVDRDALDDKTAVDGMIANAITPALKKAGYDRDITARTVAGWRERMRVTSTGNTFDGTYCVHKDGSWLMRRDAASYLHAMKRLDDSGWPKRLKPQEKQQLASQFDTKFFSALVNPFQVQTG